MSYLYKMVYMERIDGFPLSEMFLPTSDCPLEVARGVRAFKKELMECSACSITSKTHSVFSIIKRHLDMPIRNLFEEHGLTYDAKTIVPSKFGDIPPAIKNNHLNVKPLSAYEKAVGCFYLWEDFLRNRARQDPPEPIFETYETLTFFLYDLHHLKPKQELIGFGVKDSITKISTTRVGGPGYGYCELCWRHTVRYKNAQNDSSYQGKLGSTKYCSHHVPNGKTAKNYHRDRRYKQRYDAALKSLSFSKNWRETKKRKSVNNLFSDSGFLPPLRWYLENLPGLDFQEQRKVAYNLAQSGLENKNRKKVITLKGQGKTTIQIAEILKISRQAVSKHIREIEKAVNHIFSDAFLDRKTRQPTKLSHKQRVVQELRYTQETPYIHPSSEYIAAEIIKIKNVKEVEASEIYLAAFEDYDRPYKYRW